MKTKKFTVSCKCGFRKVFVSREEAKREERKHKNEFPGHHPEVR